MVVHYDPSRIWFINNIIHDCNYGIISTGAFDVYAVGNVFYGISETATESHADTSTYRTGAAIRAYNTGSMYVHNNTIYDSVIGVSYDALAGYVVDITGNIMSSMNHGETTGHNPYAIMLKGNSTNIASSDIDYNLFYSPLRVHIGATTYTSISSLQSGASKCMSNCLSANPLFVSAPINMQLRLESPAINASLPPFKVISDMMDLYGLSYNKDLTGIYRPQNSFWDIGAYEYALQIRADVDNSAIITTTDALLTLRNSLGLSMDATAWQASSTTGDVNCDGVSNSTDALLILRHSLGLSMSGTGWCE